MSTTASETKPPEKPRGKIKSFLVNTFIEGNVYSCLLIVAIINAILYLFFFFSSLENSESHISCIVGLMALGCSVWVAYWAKTLKIVVIQQAHITELIKLQTKLGKDSTLTYLEVQEAEDIAKILDFILMNDNKLERSVVALITNAHSELESDISLAVQQGKKISKAPIKCRIDTIINVASKNK